MKRILLLSLAVLIWAAAPGLQAKAKSKGKAAKSYPKVEITMEKGGKILMELYPDSAPKTVANFIKLAKQGFYDGLTFHRRVEGFVIQGGDPNGNGTGGPGWTVPAEFNERKHLRGTLAMARASDPDSAGSQFYICLAAQPNLDHQYTVFGQVLEGMDVVDAVQVGDKMKSVKVLP